VDDPGAIRTPSFKDLCQYGRFLHVYFFILIVVSLVLKFNCCGPRKYVESLSVVVCFFMLLGC